MSAPTTTNNNNNNIQQPIIRLSVGPHIALRNGALANQRRKLQRRIDQYEQTANTTTSSLEASCEEGQQQQQHFTYPSRLPYHINNNNQSGTAPPAPTQSLQGTHIGSFRPPQRYLRSVQPAETASQLLSIAQQASAKNSPYSWENISSQQAPEKSKEHREREAREEKQREEEIKELKEKLEQLTIKNNNNSNNQQQHVFAPTAKPFVSAIPVTSTRQSHFQMNTAVKAAAFTPAFLRNAAAATTTVAQKATEEPMTTKTPPGENNNNNTIIIKPGDESGSHSSSINNDPDDNHPNHNHNSNSDESPSTTTFASKYQTTTTSPVKTSASFEEQEEEDREEKENNTTNNKNKQTIFSSIPVTEFDAVFIRHAPMPCCYLSTANGGKDQQQQQTSLSKLVSSSSTATPTIEEATASVCESHHQNNNNDNTDETVYTITNFMALRHNISSLSAESAQNISDHIYHDWEKHLSSAIQSCKAGSSSLMVSERNLPPLYVGRPEYHQMVEERVEYFKKNPQEMKDYQEELKSNNNSSNGVVNNNNIENEGEERDCLESSNNNNNNENTTNYTEPKSEYEASAGHLSHFTTTKTAAFGSSHEKRENSLSTSQFDGANSSGNVSPSRGGLFALPTYGRPQKLNKGELHNKVLSILSRVTPEKYHALREELLNLPIRQASKEQLTKVVDVFFHKAVQEPKFSGVYADLVMSVFETAQEEKEALIQRQQSASTSMISPQTGGSSVNNAAGGQFPAAASIASTYSPTPLQSDSLTAFEARSAARTEQLAHTLRNALLQKCHAEFSREPKLRDKDLIDKETGKQLNREDQEDKWSSLKKRLKGNVRFVGELYNRGAVTDSVVNAALSVLLMQIGALACAKIPPYARGGACQCFNDHLVDVFVTLLDTVGPKFRAKMPERCNAMVETARKLSVSHRTPRTRVLLLNLVDNADGKGEKRWTYHTGNSPKSSSHHHPTSHPTNPQGTTATATAQYRQSHLSSALPSTASMSRLGSMPGGMGGSLSRMGSTQDLSVSYTNNNNSHGTPNNALPPPPPPPPPHPSYNSHRGAASMTGSPTSPHPGSGSLGLNHHQFGGSNSNLHAMMAAGGSSSSTTTHNNSGPSSTSKPPPPSYDHFSSSPTSPTNNNNNNSSSHPSSISGTPPNQANGLVSSLPPPLGKGTESKFPATAPASQNTLTTNGSSSLSLSSPITMNKKHNIFVLSRSASPEMKNSLASLPSSSHCDLCAEECVSLGEALCGIERSLNTNEESDSQLTPEQLKLQHLLSFIPFESDAVKRQTTLREKVWEPAEKLSIVAHDETEVTNLFASILASSYNNNNNNNNDSEETKQDQDQTEDASPVLSSGLGFLIAHSVAAPSGDGSGNRILEPQVAKKALVNALKKVSASSSADDQDDQLFMKKIRSMCVGGDQVSVHEHQSRASNYFEALGGGNEESEGYSAAQRLFRSWGNFVTVNL